MLSWSQKNKSENFQRNFHAEFFGSGRGKPLCRHSIHCCFVSRS